MWPSFQRNLPRAQLIQQFFEKNPESGNVGAVAGAVGYFFIGGRSILMGLLAFTLSRVLMRFWQIARPHAFPRNRASPSITIAFAIMWVFLSILLSIPLWAKS